MSAEKTYQVGIFAPKSLNDYNVIEDNLLDKAKSISHVYTNNVGHQYPKLFCERQSLPYTVIPIPHTPGGTLESNRKIIENSDWVLVFDDGESKNAKNVIEDCERMKVPFKVYTYKSFPRQERYFDLLTKIGILMEADTPDYTAIKKMIKKELRDG